MISVIDPIMICILLKLHGQGPLDSEPDKPKLKSWLLPLSFLSLKFFFIWKMGAY